MALTALFIIYLTFGAPVAVYKYLQNRAAPARRRILVSALTFVFWIPAVAEIGYLYFSNAYFGDGFVSPINSDSGDRGLVALREAMNTELTRISRGSNLHLMRDSIDRYVGLAASVRSGVLAEAAPHELFKAAGRNESELGRLCLMR